MSASSGALQAAVLADSGRVRAHTEVQHSGFGGFGVLEPAGFVRPARRTGIPGAYFFLLRLVPVVPTMTTTFV